MADRRQSPPFIWAEVGRAKFQVMRLVIGRASGYRLDCTTDTQAKAEHLVAALTGDGPETIA